MAESKFFRGDVSAPSTLDDKGRCCGRKPLTYKREGRRFCDRCNRSYDYYQNFQIDNWAWKRRADGQFEYVTGAARLVAPTREPQTDDSDFNVGVYIDQD